MGETEKTENEFVELLTELSNEYLGDTYHILTKFKSLKSSNCNHFSSELCLRLVDKEIPKWINRLANIASCIPCFVPPNASIVNAPTKEDYDKAQRSND